MKLQKLIAAAAGLVLAGASAFAQSKPTVAVLYFNNSVLGAKANEDYAPLSKGMADLMIQELSVNPGIRVVERDRIQAVLEEQKLSTDGKTDAATSVKVGKLLGAKHMVAGTFVIDLKGTTMNITLKVFNTETSEIEYSTTVTGKPDNLFVLINHAAAAINKNVKLPDIPKQVSDAAEKKAEKIPYAAIMLYSRGLNAKDAGKSKEAVDLFSQAVKQFPQYDAAQKELDKMGGKAGN
jgi:TolB-like protein